MIIMTLDDELLCVADTKLVMGNWLAETVMNGRSLPDFAAMLGMCTTCYGQTRAIYQRLAGGQAAYAVLERGRGADEIRSMNLLDGPPQDWEDLVATIWLAERATWAMMSGFLGHPDPAVAALARKVGEEAYFHLKYAAGWFKVLADDPGPAGRLADALARRLPLAVDWFGPPADADPLRDGGQRDAAVAELRAQFESAVTADLKAAGLAGGPAPDEPVTAADGDQPGPWQPASRRHGPLPAGLFEVIRFKDTASAH
jgi:ring-1,2-phenylacetyl-CoA epoxidase subunit PaaC